MKNQLRYFEILLSDSKYLFNNNLARLAEDDYTHDIHNEGRRLNKHFNESLCELANVNNQNDVFKTYLHKLGNLKGLCEIKTVNAFRYDLLSIDVPFSGLAIWNLDAIYNEVTSLIELISYNLRAVRKVDLDHLGIFEKKILPELDKEEYLDLKLNFFFHLCEEWDILKDATEIDNPLEIMDEPYDYFSVKGIPIHYTYGTMERVNMIKKLYLDKGKEHHDEFSEIKSGFKSYYEDENYYDKFFSFIKFIDYILDEFPFERELCKFINDHKNLPDAKIIIEDFFIEINFDVEIVYNYFTREIMKTISILGHEGKLTYLNKLENRVKLISNSPKYPEQNYRLKERAIPLTSEYLLGFIQEEKDLIIVDESNKNNDNFETNISSNTNKTIPEKITFLGTVEDLGLLTELLFNVGLIRNKKEKSKVSRVLANSISTVDKENISADYLYNCFSSKEFSDKKISDMKTKVIKILEELNNLSEN